MFSLPYTAVVVSGKVGPVKPVNYTSWVALVAPTDHPKSVHNFCVFELFFVALFVLSFCPFDISAGVGDFVIGLSQISSFFSIDKTGKWILTRSMSWWFHLYLLSKREERKASKNYKWKTLADSWISQPTADKSEAISNSQRILFDGTHFDVKYMTHISYNVYKSKVQYRTD